MTKAKRVEKLKHFITCLKCEVSGKCCDNNCPTQYNAGNMGEIIENLEEIARALEQEPTTKNDLGVDCISRDVVKNYIQAHIHEIITESGEDKNKHTNRILRSMIHGVNCMPSVTPQPCEDAISRQALLNATVNKNSIWNKTTDSEGNNLETIISNLPSVTTQETNIKALGEELRKVRGGISDKKVLVGYNMAVAICNKYLAEQEVEGNDD